MSYRVVTPMSLLSLLFWGFFSTDAKALSDLQILQNQLMSTNSINAVGNRYFSIDEGNNSAARVGFSSPSDLTRELAASAPRNVPIPLTRWLQHNSAPPVPPVKYNRLNHFGTWILDPTGKTCVNTRAQVLIRDSKSPVTYWPNDQCVVKTGTWDDPYTGRRFFASGDIQIDHVVPLKQAFDTGAWRWNYKSRCTYGNFMANNYHLLPVNSRENMSKGDKSPERYMPPNRKVTCSYLQAWLQIKLAWGLIMLDSEAKGIQDIFKRSGCNASQFTIDRQELLRQRKAMTVIAKECFAPPLSPNGSMGSNGFPTDY
jgi:hypothetical protein